MSKKIKAAIIGPGNIGTDLLMKALRSEVIEPVWMVGVEPDSPGLARAKELGLKTTAEGVAGMLPSMQEDGVQICFDATSAYVHAANSREVNGSRYEDEFSGNGVFFFPSSVGLALLARYPQVETAWTLNMYDEEKLAELFGLVAFRPKITTVDRQTVTIGHTQHNARHVTIAWGDQTRRLWLSDDGWTLKMQRDDGLAALETRTIRT